VVFVGTVRKKSGLMFFMLNKTILFLMALASLTIANVRAENPQLSSDDAELIAFLTNNWGWSTDDTEDLFSYYPDGTFKEIKKITNGQSSNIFSALGTWSILNGSLTITYSHVGEETGAYNNQAEIMNAGHMVNITVEVVVHDSETWSMTETGILIHKK
jgi:hypothetical protein